MPIRRALLVLLALGCEEGVAPAPPAWEAPAPTPAAEPEAEPAPEAWQSARYPATAASGAVEIHFTRPGTEPGAEEDPEADDAIVEVLAGAESSVDLCFFEFDRASVVDAAADALMRGVQLRFVGDGDELGDEGYQRLAGLGLELALRAPNDRIMHNKFAVVDARTVLTGSMNMTETGVLRNNNNLLRLEDPALADAYAAEFQQMWEQHLFGRSKEPIEVARAHELNGRGVEVYFSPEDNPVEQLRRVLASADHSVFFLVFSYTHPDVAADMIALDAAGVTVAGVMDESQAWGRYSVDEELAAAGVPVYIDGNENASGFSGGKLHHKVLIVDAGTDSDPTVVTGSFNWSKSATQYNDENLLILHGADFVAPFLEEFCEVQRVATLHPSFVDPDPDPCAGLLVSVRINELLPNPDGTDRDEEYVEIVNAGAAAVQLGGWTLTDGAGVRHTFAERVLAPAASLVVYGGASEAEPRRVIATTTNLGLTNTSDTVSLVDATGTVVDAVSYVNARSGVAFNRDPDGGRRGELVLHTDLSGRPTSPGRRVDGTFWPGEPVVILNELMPNPDGTDLGSEYVEIVNVGTGSVDISGWSLGDVYRADRHVFEPQILEPGGHVLLYDRGEHEGASVTSSGLLSLSNAEETITLYDADGRKVDEVSYVDAPSGIAFNRAVDGDRDASWVTHDTLGMASSPGARADGSPWIAEPPRVVVLINEVLPDPEGTDSGQEFVELVNVGEGDVDLGGWHLGDDVNSDRHVFAGGRIIPVGGALVVYDRGEHPGHLLSSSGSLSLNNGGDVVTLYRADGVVADAVVYGAAAAGVSFNRAADGVLTEALVRHDEVPGAAGPTSPGAKVDGTPW